MRLEEFAIAFTGEIAGSVQLAVLIRTRILKLPLQ
jgi:hypothetical protein